MTDSIPHDIRCGACDRVYIRDLPTAEPAGSTIKIAHVGVEHAAGYQVIQYLA